MSLVVEGIRGCTQKRWGNTTRSKENIFNLVVAEVVVGAESSEQENRKPFTV